MSALIAIGTSGMSRLPAADFGAPILNHASARWDTVSLPASRSMSAHRRPRNSEARRPVKIATTKNARQRSDTLSSNVRISALAREIDALL